MSVNRNRNELMLWKLTGDRDNINSIKYGKTDIKSIKNQNPTTEFDINALTNHVTHQTLQGRRVRYESNTKLHHENNHHSGLNGEP